MEEQATCKEQRNTLVWVGFFLPFSIYLFIGVISIFNDYITCTCNRSCIQTTHTRKCLWPPGFEWNKTAIKLSTLCGSLLYYIGDNLEQVDCNENASTISLTLSVAGLLLYRVLSVALKKLKRYYQKEEGEPRSFNLCSPNRNETHSLVIAYTFLLTIVIDFDIVFTAVLDRIGDSDISCNRTIQHPHQKTFWGLFGSMIGFFLLIELVIITIFIVTQCRHYISRRDRCEPIRKCCESMRTCLLSKVKLTLPTRECKSLIVFILLDIGLSVIVLVAVIFFLLADNEQVLQCFIRVPEGDESTYRIGFLLTSFGLCSFVMFGFLIRKWGRCVQIKGKITQVTIEDGQQLEVKVQNEVGNQKYTFNYNIATKKIKATTCEQDVSPCDHAELYRNDIERVIKLPKNKITIKEVNVNNDNNQIIVHHSVHEPHYKIVFSTKDPPDEDIIETLPPPAAEDPPQGPAVEDQVHPQPRAAGGEHMIQDGEDLPQQKRIQERRAESGIVPLHSPVSDSHGTRRERSFSPASGASEHSSSSASRSNLSVLELHVPHDPKTIGLHSRSLSPDIKNDQRDESEETSLLK